MIINNNFSLFNGTSVTLAPAGVWYLLSCQKLPSRLL